MKNLRFNSLKPKSASNRLTSLFLLAASLAITMAPSIAFAQAIVGPGVDKSFANAGVTSANVPVQLTITIANPNATLGDDATNASLTDTLPTNLFYLTSPPPTTSCGGTFSFNNPATTLTFTGGSIAAGSPPCTLTVFVIGGNCWHV